MHSLSEAKERNNKSDNNKNSRTRPRRRRPRKRRSVGRRRRGAAPLLIVDSSHMCIHRATRIAHAHTDRGRDSGRIRNTRALQRNPLLPPRPLLRQTDAHAEVRQQPTKKTSAKQKTRDASHSKEGKEKMRERASFQELRQRGADFESEERERDVACVCADAPKMAGLLRELTAVFSPSFALTASCASRPGAAAPPPSPARHSTPT